MLALSYSRPCLVQCDHHELEVDGVSPYCISEDYHNAYKITKKAFIEDGSKSYSP